MIALTLRNTWAHKGRLGATVLAILLGVAFFSGTLILTATLRATFDDLFSNVYRNTDVSIRGGSAFNDQSDINDGRALIDQDLLQEVVAVEGVKAAAPGVQGIAQPLSKTGKLLNTGGAPPFGYAWLDVTELNPYQLIRGTKPINEDDVVIDAGLAKKGKFAVGESIDVLISTGTLKFNISGIATFGSSDSAAGASAVLFRLDSAQKYLSEPGTFTDITILAEPGVTQEALRDRIDSALNRGSALDIQTGAESLKETQKIFRTFIDGFGNFLTAFALVAVLVGSFVIYNSFAILVAQRSREMALMRAIGAGRAQVTVAQLVEALIIGVVSAVLGLIAGVGVAAGLRSVFNAIGLTLPDRGLVVKPSTLISGMILGVTVTVLSAIVPSLRAGKIKPMAALREQAVDRSATSRVRKIVGVVLIVATAGVFALGQTGKGNGALIALGFSFLLAIITAIVIGPVVARPLAGVLGGRVSGAFIIVLGGLVGLMAFGALVRAAKAPGAIVAAPLLGLFAFGLVQAGLAAQKTQGALARENARRNPARTSTTALALTIGVAIVAGIGTMLWSLIGTFTSAVEDGTKAPYLVASNGFLGFPNSVQRDIAAIPGVTKTSQLKQTSFQIDGDTKSVAVVNGDALSDLVDVGRVTGDFAKLTDGKHIAVAEESMKINGWKLNDSVKVGFSNGTESTVAIAATYEKPGPLNNTYYLAGPAAFKGFVTNPFINLIWVQTDGKTSAKAIEAAADKALEQYPSAEFVTKDQFVNRQLSQVGPIFGVIGLLLAMSFLIAMLGIANTIKLSTLERTRELGLLRAVGMQKGQVRTMIRWEAVVVSLIGTAIGLLIGIGYGAALVSKASADGAIKLRVPFFAIPVLALFATAVGLAAAARTGRRAAKINVLQAIATD
jgi:putative ABC transport system permease protein